MSATCVKFTSSSAPKFTIAPSLFNLTSSPKVASAPTPKPPPTIAINADTLTAIQAAGTYMLTYFVTAGSGNDSIFISSSGALT